MTNPTPLGWEEDFNDKFKGLFYNELTVSNLKSHYNANEELKSFIKQVEADAERKGKREARNMIVKLRKEYANTPLDERGNGWTWLDKLDDLLTQTKI